MQSQIEEPGVIIHHYICNRCPLWCDLYRRTTSTAAPKKVITGNIDPCSQVYFELQEKRA